MKIPDAIQPELWLRLAQGEITETTLAGAFWWLSSEEGGAFWQAISAKAQMDTLTKTERRKVTRLARASYAAWVICQPSQ